jgi:anti-sigma factor RsiW
MHPNEDDLLQYVLQTLGEFDHAEIRKHLSQCEQCRACAQKLEQEIERLGSVRIRVDGPRVPRLPGFSFAPVRRWGWAAGLAAGFLLGILTAHLAENNHPVAVPQRLITTAASSGSSGYVSCQAMDVRTALWP